MSVDLDVSDKFVLFRIDDAYFPIILAGIFAAVADVQNGFAGIVQHTVGANIKGDGVEKRQRVSAKHAELSIISAGDEDFIEGADKSDPLWLLEAGDTAQRFSGSQVNYFKGTIL